jgi:hypothetical protein
VKIINREKLLAILAAMIALISVRAPGQPIYLAGNYDGTNYDGSSCDVGFATGYTFEAGANFTVAGTGDFNLTRVIMPLGVYSSFGGIPNQTSNLANYLVSVVADNSGRPTGDVVGAFTPFGLSTSSANYAFDITGTVPGGSKYWLMCTLIAPDSGCIDWNLAWSPLYIGTGYVARRWSDDGVPIGPWTITTGSGSVQTAFLIEGTTVIPEPGVPTLLILGIIGLVIRGCLHRRTA